MNYKQSLEFLNSLDDYEKKKSPSKNRFLNLERIHYACKLLGNPEKKFPSILIGGTNGKGSTAFYLSESLKVSGYKVGLYTSPHLEDLRERIRVNGCLISEGNFAKESSRLRLKLEQHPLPEKLGRLTYFEWITLLAFLFFESQKVDIAVLEVGMGGRLDATNCTAPLLTLLTPISLDHTRELGESLELIAKEKSYLIQAGRPALLSKQDGDARKVLMTRAKKEKSPVYEEGVSFSWDFEEIEKNGKIFLKWIWVSNKTRIEREFQGKPAYLLQNISLALKALELLKSQCGFKKISLPKVLEVVEDKVWSGRFDIVRKKPTILLDGVHNPGSAKAFSQAILNLYPKKKKILIFAAASDKKIESILKNLKRVKPESFIATQFQNPRAASSERIAKLGKGIFKNIQNLSNLKLALRKVLQSTSKEDLIIVCGSLYLVGEARKILTSRISEL